MPFSGALTSISIVAFLVATIPSAGAVGEPPNLRLGACVAARIASIGYRLENEPSSGANITLTNGIVSMSYKADHQAALARVGDRVIACLISVPEGCPKGDGRGKVYTVVNLRTYGSWTMPNDEHSCGGA